MSAEQGDVAVMILSALGLTSEELNEGERERLTEVLDRLAAALERAELDRDEAIESWQYWRAHGDRELRARAEEAERALAEIKGWAESGAHVENDAGRDASDFIRIAILAGADPEALRAALRSEDTSDE